MDECDTQPTLTHPEESRVRSCGNQDGTVGTRVRIRDPSADRQ
jgi:hypothetical protein